MNLQAAFTAVRSGDQLDVYLIWSANTAHDVLAADAMQLTTATVPPGSLTANASFETGATGWTSYNGTVTAPVAVGDAPDGAKVAEVQATTPSGFTLDDYPGDVASSTAGVTYNASVWIKAADAAAANQGMTLNIREYAGSVLIGSAASPAANLSASAYQPLRVSYTAMQNGDHIDMYATTTGSVSSGAAFYADAAGLTATPQAPTPSTNLTSNPSFETGTAGANSYNGTLAQVASPTAPSGAYVAQVTAGAGAPANGYTLDEPVLTGTSEEGMTYTGSAWAEAANLATSGKQITPVVRETTPAGSPVSHGTSAPVTLSRAAFSQLTLKYTALHLGDNVDIYLAPIGSIATGDSFLGDAITLTPDPRWFADPTNPVTAWDSLIPASPTVLPGSPAMVADVFGAATGNSANFTSIGQFSTGPGETAGHIEYPTYYSTTADSRYTVSCAYGSSQPCFGSTVVHIPAGAVPESGEDGHMTVIDQTTSPATEYDFYQTGCTVHGFCSSSSPAAPFVAKTPSYCAGLSGGTCPLSVSTAGQFPVTGTGASQGVGLGQGANAAHVPLEAGLIHAGELFATPPVGSSYPADLTIQHVLALDVPCERATAGQQFVYPANGTATACQTNGTPTTAPPLGQRYYLAGHYSAGTWIPVTPAAIFALNEPQWKTNILLTLRYYGAIVTDTNGSGTDGTGNWSLFFEDSSTYLYNGGADPWTSWTSSNLLDGLGDATDGGPYIPGGSGEIYDLEFANNNNSDTALNNFVAQNMSAVSCTTNGGTSCPSGL